VKTVPTKRPTGITSLLFRAIAKRKDVKVGLGILMFFVVLASVSLVYTPYAPLASVGPPFSPPSTKFLFGTNNIGQDVFSQWMFGTRSTLLVGFFAALMTAILGVYFGVIAGYVSQLDEPLMRLADVTLTIPALPLLIVVSAFISPSDLVEAILIAILSWAGMSRVLRSSVLSLKSMQFVEVAILSNVPSYRIMFVDIIRHTLALILAYSLFAVGGAILTVASLDFIGIGPVTDYSWGSMISLANDNSALLAGAWWWPLFPGLSIALLVSGLALIAYGLEAGYKNL
jgi:peptide/nickel transport system permease protein